MAALIPDWIWRILPDSMGGYISAVWVILFWILRHLALRSTEDSTSPSRGLLCTAAAFFGSVALFTGGLVLLALYYIPNYGLLLAIAGVPVSIVAGIFARLLYRGARGDFAQSAAPNQTPSTAPPAARKDAA